MDRRDFLKKTAALGLGAGVLFLPKGLRAPVSRALAAEAKNYPDLVALKGKSPEAMFDRGIASLGGMGRFVAKGQTVVIKPNMSFDVPASIGGSNTSPALVARVVKHCFDAGARRVLVMDHSIEFWERTLEVSGVGAAIKASGATYTPADDEKYYQNVAIKAGRTLNAVQVHEALLEKGNVLINVPVLKNHGGAGVSISIKNLMGCVWDRRAYHNMGVQQCIADFLNVRKPDLNVVDASRALARNGPRGGSPEDVVAMNSQIISPDVVAADMAASMLFGYKAGDIEHIRLAAEAGFGQMDLSKLRIERITL